MCRGLESILFGTLESAACPRGRVKYIPRYARSQPVKGVFIIVFFFLSTEDGSLCARIIQTLNRNNIVSIFACELIGSRYFKFNQKRYRESKCNGTENANLSSVGEAGEIKLSRKLNLIQ